jgi:4-hydroxy-3-polyprenylbenzoate decarboxylase
MGERIIIGISGASGAIYGIRALQLLRAVPGVETHLIVTKAGRATIAAETAYTLGQVTALADAVYPDHDLAAPPSSGSFRAAGMLVAPCSIKTLSGIANCYDDTLLIRAADVALKERRRLVLLVRETPLRAAHLRLMTEVTSNGAIVAPPVPAFYASPRTIDDLVDHTVGRALDLFGIDTGAVRRWTGLRAVPARPQRPGAGPALTPPQDRPLPPAQDRPLPRLRTGALADAAHQHLEEGLGWRHQRFARAPHHPQLPLGVWLGERKARTLTAGGQPRQHGHPHPGLHHSPHDRKLPGLDRDPRREPGSRAHVHHEVAQPVPGLHRHEVLAGQAGEADPGAARQPVTWRHQRHHRLPYQGLTAQVGACAGHPDDRQVELAGVHHPFELPRDVVLDQSDLHPWVAPPEPGENAR